VSKIVLCVDDSATMQQVADITFRGTEFTYVGARSYEEGLDKAKTQRPVVVLADSVMPGKNGYDLCLALKSHGATAEVPVVILIGNGAPFDAARGTQVGADANLPKPWDTQTMLDKVIEVVTKAASGVVRPGAAAAPAPTAPTPAAVPAAAAPAAALSKPNPATAAAAAASAAAAAPMPPRSATIMGMPTVKGPAGTAPVVPMAAAPPAPAPPAPVAPPATPSRHVVAATPPPTAPASTATVPGTSAGLRAPAPTPARGHDGVAPAAAAPAAASAPAISIATSHRPPMVSGIPTKRSAIVERALAKMAARLAETAGLEPGSPELLALLKLSTEVVERIVWEVVPDLAEQIIRENLQELAARRS
jgi:CheY-like chemotaxis protein